MKNEKGHFVKGNYPLNTKVPLALALEIKRAVFNRGARRLKDLLFDYDVSYQYLKEISAGRILVNR